MNNLPEWLPPHKTRISQRAKYCQIKISAQHGLEIVIPARNHSVDIQDFLRAKKHWILKHADVIAKNLEEARLPTEIRLATLGQSWDVSYQSSLAKPQLIIRPHGEIVVLADQDDFKLCQKLLLDWLKKVAKYHLLSQLAELAKQCELSYRRASIRIQKTRWGSCSSEHDIQLNALLLFFTPEVSRYVMIHELCHTQHLNHSQRYWRLVKRFDPNYEQHIRSLRKEQETLPKWALQN